tara:strand:- start:34595 stop:35644 length:1050 start_codon:yes stop_codon:yes gene_type:complete
MWYYSTKESLKNFPRILLFVVLSFIQKANSKAYKSYSFLGDFDSEISNYYFLKNIQICKSNNKKKCDCLILINEFNYKKIFSNILQIKRMRIVGINFFGHYGINMLINTGYFDFSTATERDSYKDLSFTNYQELKTLINNQDVHVLGNAPEFSKIIENLTSQPLFICNDSINIIDKINSPLIVVSFADPLFHFSYDQYSLEFIKRIKKIENKIDFIIVPSNALPIIKKAGIKTKFIGVTSSKKLKVNFMTKENKIYTKNTHNVMTQYMLPLACSLTDNIYLGAVSFQIEKDLNSVWDYDQKMMNEKNKNYAFDYSFFRDRDFKRYYRYHNKMLNKIIKTDKKINIYEHY